MSATRSWQSPAWLLGNVAFLLVLGIGAAASGADSPRLAYLVLLFALCSSPLLWMQRFNDRYSMLALQLSIYFMFFGAADVAGLLRGTSTPLDAGWMSHAEWIILAGAAALVTGYRFAIAAVGTGKAEATPPDWRPAAVIAIGLLLWAVGTAAVWYWQIHVVVRRSVEIDNPLGAWGTMGLMLGRMIQPLGIMMLAYAMARQRRSWIAVLVVAVVLAQVLIGFLADSKETAMRGGLIVIIVLLMVRGRIPWMWIAAAAAFVLLAFPVFQAYRAEVAGARGYTNEKAAQNLGKVIELALAARDRVTEGTGGEQFRAQSFIERITLKNSVRIVADRVGTDVEHQRGATLLPLLAAFVPRVVWPEKPAAAAGQVFNREFGISQYRDVYISPSHLGELHWNFGWPGTLLGMLSIGALLGWIGARCDLSKQPSLTRLLVVAVTIYSLCVRFEGSIAVEYVVWLRSMAAIALLHLLFARRADRREVRVPPRFDAEMLAARQP